MSTNGMRPVNGLHLVTPCEDMRTHKDSVILSTPDGEPAPNPTVTALVLASATEAKNANPGDVIYLRPGQVQEVLVDDDRALGFVHDSVILGVDYQPDGVVEKVVTMTGADWRKLCAAAKEKETQEKIERALMGH